MKSSSALVVLLLLAHSLFAQVAELKWGDLPEEDLTMTSYPDDPEANAVVLDEVMELEIEFTGSNDFSAQRIHRRIKILTEAGIEDQADVEIPYYSRQRYRGISQLRAQVIQPDGTIIPVDTKAAYDDRKNAYYSVRAFGFPDVKVGSILEYSYVAKIPSLFFPPSWSFQDAIPTRRSVLFVKSPRYLEYIGILMCSDTDNMEDQKKSRVFQVKHNPNLVGEPKFRTIPEEGVYFVGESMPAIEDVAYLSTTRNYSARIEFQLRSYNPPGSPRRDFIKNWQEHVDEYLSDDDVKSSMVEGKPAAKMFADLGPMLRSDVPERERIENIYNWVNTKIDWNKEYEIYPGTNLKNLLKTRQGNSADINLLLVSLLRAAGVDAKPVLVRMRDDGRVITAIPRLQQFDSVIACAFVEDKPVFMNALGSAVPAGLLGTRYLNYEGLIIDPEASWIGLQPRKDTETVYIKARYEDGEIHADWSCSFDNYTAFERRNFLLTGNDPSDEEYLDEFYREALPDAEIEDFEITNRKALGKKFKEKCTVVTTKGVSEAGDMLYISPVLMGNLEENPLREETRNLPIEFPYPAKERYIFSFTIPEGYAVESLPETVSVRAADYGCKFVYRVAEKDGIITVNAETEITGLLMPAEAYEAIKQVFDMIVEKHGEMIVLRRV